ncbi:MAG: NAD(P)-dependent oxidoreductase [Chloroflexi bacterium]|nr:NAD(P)-dependent oxidoreductase [Chloroflexota bacterium]
MKIIVTGGSGKGGRWVVRDLRDHGHEVVNVDLVSDGAPNDLSLLTDLTDLGQVVDVVRGADAVVHFAAIPAPGLRPEGETFRINTVSTWNVFHAAVRGAVGRIVWASSETTLGLPFDRPPDFAPIDETITVRPESSYALSKVVGETIATQLNRVTGIPFVGLRISNIMEPADYSRFPSWQDDSRIRKWNLWGYVDARDVAQAVRRGVEGDTTGAEVCIVAAADTVMRRDSAELLAEVFPDVPVRGPISGRQTLLAIGRARELLGYHPEHSWLDPA